MSGQVQAKVDMGALMEVLGDQLDYGDDLTAGVSIGFPVLSLKGKVFTVKEGGESEMVLNPETSNPAQVIQVVMVKANKHVSKVFYANGYEEGSTEPPTCYSNDGTVPAADSTEVQSRTCETCKNNQWGSRIADNGNKAKACSDSRRTAVAAVGDLEKPMLLRVPAASLKPLMQFGQALSKRRVPYQAVVINLTFDFTVSHPLLKFGVARAVTVAEAKQIKELLDSETVGAILHGGNASQVASELAEVGDEDELAKAAAAAGAAGLAAEDPTPTPASAKAVRTPSAAKATPNVSAETVAAAVAAPTPAAPPRGTRKKATPPPEPTPAEEVTDEGLGQQLDDLLGSFE